MRDFQSHLKVKHQPPRQPSKAAKTIIAPVTTPENAAEKGAELNVLPLAVWPWDSPITVFVTSLLVAVLLLVIVGQFVPVQLTLPSEGLAPTKASTTMTRSGD